MVSLDFPASSRVVAKARVSKLFIPVGRVAVNFRLSDGDANAWEGKFGIKMTW